MREEDFKKQRLKIKEEKLEKNRVFGSKQLNVNEEDFRGLIFILKTFYNFEMMK